MKVTFEIDINMLKAAAGVLAATDPSIYDDVMKLTYEEDVLITKEHLQLLSATDKNYYQLPFLIALVVITKRSCDETLTKTD